MKTIAIILVALLWINLFLNNGSLNILLTVATTLVLLKLMKDK